MSFSYGYTARSKSDARSHLEKFGGSVPATVRELLLTAINAIGPQSGHELRAIKVFATGHLAEKPGDYSHSTADIKVEPIFALE
jgi:hypothetical protein